MYCACKQSSSVAALVGTVSSAVDVHAEGLSLSFIQGYRFLSVLAVVFTGALLMISRVMGLVRALEAYCLLRISMWVVMGWVLERLSKVLFG